MIAARAVFLQKFRQLAPDLLQSGLAAGRGSVGALKSQRQTSVNQFEQKVMRARAPLGAVEFARKRRPSLFSLRKCATSPDRACVSAVAARKIGQNLVGGCA